MSGPGRLTGQKPLAPGISGASRLAVTMHEGVTSAGEGTPREAGLLGRTPPWALSALVFLVVLGSYWPCLRGGLLWDDAAHVTRADLRPLGGLFRIWANLRETQQYYPVLHSAFWLEYRLWGASTLGYHLVNVGLHGLNACLVALLLARLRVPKGAAWLAALLFAAHPVCVESVAWISEQKNTLSLAFYLLSARAFLGFSENRRASSYLQASLLFCAALGTKSVTATLPAALLLVLWWSRGRLPTRRDVAPLLPWFLVAGASGALTAWVERHVVGAQGAAFDLTPVERLLLAGRVVWFYLGKLLWPSDLMFIYPHWRIDSGDPRSWAPLAAAGTLTAGLWLMRGRLRGACAGWLFFVGSLFPAMGIVSVFPFLYSYVADHFQYLASLGVFAVAACGAYSLVGRMPVLGRVWARAACALLVAGLAFLSRLQSATYRDSETLYTATLERNPACWMAENNLGAELAERGRAGEALSTTGGRSRSVRTTRRRTTTLETSFRESLGASPRPGANSRRRCGSVRNSPRRTQIWRTSSRACPAVSLKRCPTTSGRSSSVRRTRRRTTTWRTSFLACPGATLKRPGSTAPPSGSAPIRRRRTTTSASSWRAGRAPRGRHSRNSRRPCAWIPGSPRPT